MSISIKSLPKIVAGKCIVCSESVDLKFWDADLGARICGDCEPHLTAAESTLIGLKYGHPNEFLVFRNP